ncbi:radical SAM protein [bacterium]|nr:radical SAM protein [bacterium]
MFRYHAEYDGSKCDHPSYYSCPWIQHGLVFFRYKLATCCYCGHVGGGHTLVKDDYRGEPINWEHIFKQKKTFNRLYKKGLIHDNCVNCPFLELLYNETWDREENYISNVYISHWTECNSKCIYCYATQHPEEFSYKTKNYSVLPIIKEMLEKNILRRGGNVHFGGGEPTILPEFEDLIRLLLNYKFYDLRVHTSGIKYSPILERGIREGRLRVIVSVDAGCPETFKKIKQVDAYNIVRENVRKYAAAQIHKRIALTPHLYMDGEICAGTKFIIIPGINDTEEEVENWIRADVESGVHTTIIDLEENWFKAHEDNLPQSIFDFIYKIKLLSDKYHTHFELYERLENMLKNNPDKAPWYVPYHK